MKIKALVFLLVLTLIAYFSYNYVYQEHRNIFIEKTRYHLTSDSLFNHFKNKQTEANSLYINQIIELKGVVNSISNDLLILHPGVVCKLDSNFVFSEISPNDSIKLKGRCIGFDDLFMEVKMDKIINN